MIIDPYFTFLNTWLRLTSWSMCKDRMCFICLGDWSCPQDAESYFAIDRTVARRNSCWRMNSMRIEKHCYPKSCNWPQSIEFDRWSFALQETKNYSNQISCVSSWNALNHIVRYGLHHNVTKMWWKLSSLSLRNLPILSSVNKSVPLCSTVIGTVISAYFSPDKSGQLVNNLHSKMKVLRYKWCLRGELWLIRQMLGQWTYTLFVEI